MAIKKVQVDGVQYELAGSGASGGAGGRLGFFSYDMDTEEFDFSHITFEALGMDYEQVKAQIDNFIFPFYIQIYNYGDAIDYDFASNSIAYLTEFNEENFEIALQHVEEMTGEIIQTDYRKVFYVGGFCGFLTRDGFKFVAL